MIASPGLSPDVRPALALAALLFATAGPAAARGEDGRHDDAVVDLRFDWPAPLRARVQFRRVRARTGGPGSSFTARYELRARREEDGLRLSMGGTSWSGDLPFPRALARQAIRASEEVVQEVGPEGEFAGLEGVEAIRPVLARLFEQAKVPVEASEKAIALAEAGMRAEARDLWNLTVGFWTGASLRLGERYVLQADGEIPLLPGVRAPHTVEFGVRRRVPCVPRGKALDCVEATIRATPDPDALERVGRALVVRLAPPEGKAAARDDLEPSAESEVLLVTEPRTLLPRRVVWTRSARLREGGEGPPIAEETDRSEYEYRYLRPEPSRRRPARPPELPPPELAPVEPSVPVSIEPGPAPAVERGDDGPGPAAPGAGPRSGEEPPPGGR